MSLTTPPNETADNFTVPEVKHQHASQNNQRRKNLLISPQVRKSGRGASHDKCHSTGNTGYSKEFLICELEQEDESIRAKDSSPASWQGINALA
jgi:hypothetical protein